MSSSLAHARRSGLWACLALALLTSAPTGAFAQGAGDEQYADPVVRDGGRRQPAPAPKPDTDPGTAPAAPVAPAGDTAPVTGSSQSTTPQGTATATLPRTGVAAGLLAALGTVMLASGSLLRSRSAQSVGD